MYAKFNIKCDIEISSTDFSEKPIGEIVEFIKCISEEVGKPKLDVDIIYCLLYEYEPNEQRKMLKRINKMLCLDKDEKGS